MRQCILLKKESEAWQSQKKPYLATPICALTSIFSFHSVDSLENHKIKKKYTNSDTKSQDSLLPPVLIIGPCNQFLLANSDLIQSLIHLLLFLAPTYMSRTVKSRPFPAFSASPEVWGLSLDVGAIKLNPKDWEGSGSQISQLLFLFTTRLLWKLRVSTSTSEQGSQRVPEEQWGHLKSRESLGYEPYKTQSYRHIYKFAKRLFFPQQFLLVLAESSTIRPQETKLHHWKQWEFGSEVFQGGDHCQYFYKADGTPTQQDR